MVSTPLVLAFVSAIVYAFSNSLQHLAAGSVEKGRTAVGLWRGFVSSPLWLAGTLGGGLGLALHALALGAGEIARVQPFMILGVALAVPVRALLVRRLPSRVELGTVAVALVGVGVVLVAVEPVRDEAIATGAAVVVAAVGLATLGLVGWLTARMLEDVVAKGFLLALGAGTVFGVNAAFMKTLTDDFSGGLVGLVTHWQAAAFVVAGVAGFLLNQSAYHFAPLAVTLPVVNIVAVLEATVLGMLFFDEVPSHGVGNVLGILAGVALLGLALRMTARVSPEPEHVQHSEANAA